jgi:hypothetical protein
MRHRRQERQSVPPYHRTVVGTLQRRLDLLTVRQLFLVVAIPLFVVYFSTADKSPPISPDVYTNVLTAWRLGTSGTVYVGSSEALTDPSNFGHVSWFETTPRGQVVSQYPPGAAALAAPFYVLAPATRQWMRHRGDDPAAPEVAFPLPSLVPATIASSLSVSLAMALLALVFVEFMPVSKALLGAYLAGLGTGAWSVASNALWQHGPAMLWIALALYLTCRGHLLWAGLPFGFAILTRPPLALVAATVGLAIGITKRSVRPTLEVGAGSTFGFLVLIGYNWIVFGAPSISGGYGSGFTEHALHSGLRWYVDNIAAALFDPSRGLLLWTPFLIILIPGVLGAWRAAPAWARGAALGSLLYLLLQLKANRFSGGEAFFVYRYPLEPLTAAAPVLLLAWREWTARNTLRIRLFVVSAITSVAVQAFGAIYF